MIIRDEGGANERRIQSRAIVQAKSGQFNVDVELEVGDIVEVASPSGGVRRLYVAEVKVSDVDHHPGFAGMGHVSVKWGSPATPREPRNVFNISGGSNQLAWDSQTVSQSQRISTSELRDVLQQILDGAAVHAPTGDDAGILHEAAGEALNAVAGGAEPPRRELATIKGILGDIASGVGRGVGQAAASWATQLLAAL